MNWRGGLGGFLVVCAIVSACSDSSSSTGTTTTSSGSGSQCRTYATSYSAAQTVNGALTDSLLYAYSFDKSTSTFSLTLTSVTFAPRTTQNDVWTFQYNSVADFVDEVSVVPGRTLVRTALDNNASGTANELFTYDGQNRLVTQRAISSTGSTLLWTYTAWDASGRPTAGTLAVTSGGTTLPTRQLVIVYDGSARTTTTTSTSSSGTDVSVATVDANDNSSAFTDTFTSASVTQTVATAFRVNTTAQVCK